MLVFKKDITNAIETATQQATDFINKCRSEKTFMSPKHMRAIVFVSQETARKFVVGFRFDDKSNDVGYKGDLAGKSYEIVWVA